ncbi:hypothetical protein GCM10010211_84470 [Streptomyces albospinus]|uniref:Uncharacterized protein n=1 Tax=Streptomyces albospinus TaxID=285515 RepID=A0ABQ2VRM6_9ACTN|nr:hypothetical protein GCM10010211_84470 [Streptomyces albospinus]
MGDASAWAAWVAAATSLATLIVTTVIGGRRERRKWARESLTDAFVAFLEASWAHSDVVRYTPDEQPLNVDTAQAFYAEMRSQLTRLRLLASEAVLEAGEDLLRCQRAAQEAQPGPARQEALITAARSRRLVVAAAKREMGLP